MPVPVPASTFRWYRWCRHPAEEAWKTNCQDQKRQILSNLGGYCWVLYPFLDVNEQLIHQFRSVFRLLVWFRFETMAYYTFWEEVFCFGLSSRSRNSVWGHFEGSLLTNFKRVAMKLMYVTYIYIYISPTFTMNMSQVSRHRNLGSIRYLWLFLWPHQIAPEVSGSTLMRWIPLFW